MLSSTTILVFLLFVILLLFICVVFFRINAFKKLVAPLGGKGTASGTAVFPLRGKDIFLKYVSSNTPSRDLSELHVYIKGAFGARCVLRPKGALDQFYIDIGLARELNAADPGLKDKVYFECEDQEFLNRLLINKKTHGKILGLLNDYTRIEITRDTCRFKKNMPWVPSMTQENLLKMANDVLDFAAQIPLGGADGIEFKAFESRRRIFAILGTMILALGAVCFLRSAPFAHVESWRLWLWSLMYSAVVWLVVLPVAFQMLKGFSTSPRIFLYFLLTFCPGIVLIGRYGTAIYNGVYDF